MFSNIIFNANDYICVNQLINNPQELINKLKSILSIFKESLFNPIKSSIIKNFKNVVKKTNFQINGNILIF
jgi:ribose 5-phosphate isomerase